MTHIRISRECAEYFERMARAVIAMAKEDGSCVSVKFLAELQAALAAPEEGWRAMDSAPKDGTQIIFFGRWNPYEQLPGGGPCQVMAQWGAFMSDGTGYRWIVDSCFGEGNLDSINVTFTHWCPLPPPPKEGE